MTLVRRVAMTLATTAFDATTVAALMCSLRSQADHASVGAQHGGHRGRRRQGPTITALCADVRSWSAGALNSGQPTTTPS